MPALHKPHRVGVLAPALSVEGNDTPYGAEIGILLWSALIDVLQRHPMLAVYDPESTPLTPQNGHFAPQHASVGATPADHFYSTTRRDELLWLELQLPKAKIVRLHALGRDGKRESFEAPGTNAGEQIQQALGAWLTARQLPALPRRFEAVTAEELVAAARIFAPTLVEQARLWTAPASSQRAFIDDSDETRDVDVTLESEPVRPKRRIARPVANRLTPALRVPVLRLLELALGEDLSDLILAIDADHPQALFAKYVAARGQGKDFALLRRVIAAAPCWAKPLGELVDDDAETHAPLEPTTLETIAAAGIAALCRPAQLDVIERVANHLRDDGRADEALRLMERAIALHHHDARAHISLLHLHRATDRIGAWLAQALSSGREHGCPMVPPWYPDQIQIDLLVADALVASGRLHDAVALRSNRLEGRELSWPRHTGILEHWRHDPEFAAWCYAREGFFRGDPARAVEGFGRVEPEDSFDLAIFLDSLIAMGREEDVLLAWAQFGLGRGLDGPSARLAAARCLMVAGEWRRGIEELWRVQLTDPGRDEHTAIGRCGLLMSVMPIEVAESALAERMAVGANTLARRMARDVADFVPAAAKSSIVMRALGQKTRAPTVDQEPSGLAEFPIDDASRKAIDAVFAELSHEREALPAADRLVNRWFDAVYQDDPVALATAGAYAAAHALSRYLAITMRPPTPIAGGLRTVAGEALALVAQNRNALPDRAVQALLGTIEPLLRRTDRWIGTAWLATVERCCGVDERAAGDVAGFVRDYATVAARILGPEEAAVLSASVARLHRDRPDGWESAIGAQAARLALHTGYAGVDEWADATVAQLAARSIDQDEAIDSLHTAAYIAEGASAVPHMHLARVLFGVGRAPAAVHVLSAGLHVATPAWRDRELATLADFWKTTNPGVPLDFEKVANGMFEALQAGEPARAEKLGRWAVALDPTNTEAHRNLGLALAQQGKLAEAMHHLVRGTPEQAAQILSGVLYQNGKLLEAMGVLDYASRWYTRAEQWLTYAGIAYAAMDNPRTVRAYGFAYQLEPDAFDVTQLNAYAGVLDEVGEYGKCGTIAQRLLDVAGKDVIWKTSAWNHLACAYIGLGLFDEALKYAEQAVSQNTLAENTAGFAATLERARTKARAKPHASTLPAKTKEPIFALLEAGDFAAAAAQADNASGWRIRRAALQASRFRGVAESASEVTPRARAAAAAVLADSIGLVEVEAVLARMIALEIREQAYFARDPLPRLGDRMTRETFVRELRARGGVIIGDDAPPLANFVDRVVVNGSKVARVSDFVALLRDLAALTPREALAQFDLDDAGYVEVSRAWGAAIDADPALAATIAIGLAKR